MRGFFRNRLLLLLIATLVLVSLILFSSIPGSPLFELTTPVSVVLQPVQKAVGSVWNSVSGFTKSIFEADAIRKENIDLQQQIATLQNEVLKLQENGARWDELKSAFQIKDAFADYDIVGCQIMTRSAGTLFDLFRVDVGERDGIVVSDTTSYPVVDPSMHLVGRVYSSDLVSAKVLPILYQGSVVEGRIDRPGGYPVRVSGEMELRADGLCLVDRISDDATIQAGDTIVTSGEGGLYPAGIPIGTIETIHDGVGGSGRTATLRPFVDYDKLSYLFIMKAKAT